MKKKYKTQNYNLLDYTYDKSVSLVKQLNIILYK